MDEKDGTKEKKTARTETISVGAREIFRFSGAGPTSFLFTGY
jgi:hypothetical protein